MSRKGSLAAEITRIHAAINHVPPAYVNVIFVEPPSEDVFASGVPCTPLVITVRGGGWAGPARTGGGGGVVGGARPER